VTATLDVDISLLYCTLLYRD